MFVEFIQLVAYHIRSYYPDLNFH